MERATGIEPASEAWEASILPMNYARNSSSRRNRPVDHIVTPDGRATDAARHSDVAPPGTQPPHHRHADVPDTLRSPNRLEFPCLVPWWRPRLSIR